MRAALKPGGAGSNLFPEGVATVTAPDTVLTMAKQGVVLRRPAGSNGHLAKQSGLPTYSGDNDGRGRPKRRPKPKISEKAARKARIGIREGAFTTAGRAPP